jgi:hypothetical protein
LKEDFEKKAKAKEQEKIALEKKKKYLEMLSQKAKERHEELFRQKKMLTNTSSVSRKPKYIEMDQEFKANFEIPELERRKAELAKKRIMYQPISRQDLLEHMRKCDEIAGQAEKKRKARLEDGQSDKIYLVNKERRERVLESEEEKEIRRRKLEKRLKYAENIRETRQLNNNSSIHENSVHEESVKAQKKPKEQPAVRSQPTISPEEHQPKVSKKPKKLSKINPSECKTPEVKQITRIDYLAERRKQWSLIDEQRTNSFVKNIEKWSIPANKNNHSFDFKKLDRYLSVQEQKIRHMDPNSVISLQLEEKLNDLLTQSVKAKLERCQME